jgi:hypothetical protein
MTVQRIHFRLADQSWEADLSRPVDLAAPLVFNLDGKAWFGASAAASRPFQTEQFIGDVSQGGSVNVSILTLAPHCVGTHTESSGHVTEAGHPISSIPTLGLYPTTLVTMDRVSLEAMREVLPDQNAFREALVIRRRGGPLHYHPEALRLAARQGVRHLVVEDVSVDPMDDGG